MSQLHIYTPGLIIECEVDEATADDLIKGLQVGGVKSYDVVIKGVPQTLTLALDRVVGVARIAQA